MRDEHVALDRAAVVLQRAEDASQFRDGRETLGELRRRDADLRRHSQPYLYSVALFLVGYVGLAVSLWPYIVPFQMTPADAAAADNALALMLWGAVPMLPIILGYTAYVYWLFRAKVTDEATYH